MSAIQDTSLFNDANLKAYYNFSETGTTLDDVSSNSHIGTASRSQVLAGATGKFGTCGTFVAGSSDVIRIPDHADFKPTGSFTMGAWIKSTYTDNYQLIFSSFSLTPNNTGIWMTINLTTGKAYAYSGRNTGTVHGVDYQLVMGNTVVTDGNWHFVVFEWDGSYLRFYVDGVEDATPVAWSYAPGYGATNYVRIGSYCEVGTDHYFFNGSIDDVFFFNRALTDSEISNIFTSNFSPSPSITPSASKSLSPSASQSPSLSVSLSPSIGYSDFSKGNYGSLPSNDNNLTTMYTDQDETNVSTANGVRVDQSGISGYLIHEFKNFIGGMTECTIEWLGRSSIAPSDSPVYLQVYNRVNGSWDNLTSNNTTGADADFSLIGDISFFDNYKDSRNVISCRVYQLIP